MLVWPTLFYLRWLFILNVSCLYLWLLETDSSDKNTRWFHARQKRVCDMISLKVVMAMRTSWMCEKKKKQAKSINHKRSFIIFFSNIRNGNRKLSIEKNSPENLHTVYVSFRGLLIVIDFSSIWSTHMMFVATSAYNYQVRNDIFISFSTTTSKRNGTLTGKRRVCDKNIQFRVAVC